MRQNSAAQVRVELASNGLGQPDPGFGHIGEKSCRMLANDIVQNRLLGTSSLVRSETRGRSVTRRARGHGLVQSVLCAPGQSFEISTVPLMRTFVFRTSSDFRTSTDPMLIEGLALMSHDEKSAHGYHRAEVSRSASWKTSAMVSTDDARKKVVTRLRCARVKFGACSAV